MTAHECSPPQAAYSSESQIASELNEARSELTCGLAEIAVRKVRVHIGQVVPVEHVENLEPKLEGYTVPDRGVLQEGHIRFVEVRPREPVEMLVPFESEN